MKTQKMIMIKVLMIAMMIMGDFSILKAIPKYEAGVERESEAYVEHPDVIMTSSEEQVFVAPVHKNVMHAESIDSILDPDYNRHKTIHPINKYERIFKQAYLKGDVEKAIDALYSGGISLHRALAIVHTYFYAPLQYNKETVMGRERIGNEVRQMIGAQLREY